METYGPPYFEVSRRVPSMNFVWSNNPPTRRVRAGTRAVALLGNELENCYDPTPYR